MMISTKNLGRDYVMGDNTVRALDSVDLQVEDGESLALLGPSGSGKSTLLQLLGCLDQPTRGSYALDGVEVAGLNRDQLAKLRCSKVGFVFQKFHLMPRMTALQNVCMPMRFAGVSPREQNERALDLLGRVGLADRAAHRPAELSGGQQQRVAVARALANQPRVLMADEPTGNLDSKSGADVLELLQELHSEGTTLLVVTHDRQLAGSLQRTVELADGRIQHDSLRI